MKKSIFGLLLTVCIVLTTSACSNDNDKKIDFQTINKAMQASSIHLEKNQPEVSATHYAYDPKSNTFMLGLEFKDKGLPSKETLQTIIENYLSYAASSQIGNVEWHTLLKDYNLKFEQVFKDGSKPLAEKINSNEIKYL